MKLLISKRHRHVRRPPKNRPTWRLLHEIADRRERRIGQIVLATWRKAAQKMPISRMREAWRATDIMGMIRIMEGGIDVASRNLEVSLVKELRGIVEESGELSASLVPKMVRKQEVSTEFQFNPVTPFVIEWVSRHGATLVTQVTDETKAALRELITESFRDSATIRQTTRSVRLILEDLKGGVGLTLPQQRALERLARTMAELDFADLPAEFVDRLRRSRAVGLARSGRIDAALERYRNQLIAERARMIARTEVINAAAFGQAEAWRQAVADGEISPSRMRVFWITTPDDRNCAPCRLQGGLPPEGDGTPMTREINGVYPNGVPHPTLHPNCRCGEGLYFIAKGPPRPAITFRAA